MVAFLEKPTKFEGFEQIIDFLNASSIRYALTVNPTVYVSSIDQFWATTQVKKVNGFNDEGWIDCLPNVTICEEIARMGYEMPRPQHAMSSASLWHQQSYAWLPTRGSTSQNSSWKAPPPPPIIPPTTTITPPTTTTTPPTITTPPIPSTSTPPTTTTTPTLTQPTPSIQPLQPQKQRIRRPSRRVTEVYELEKTKSSQQIQIESLERGVKKLEKSKKKRTHKLKRLYKVGLSARVMSSDDEAPVDEGEGRNEEMMFDAALDLAGEEVVVDEVAKDANLNEDEITFAQTLQKLKSTPKAKGVTIKEPSDTQRSVILKQKNLDKGKAKMIKPKKPLKRKDQILLDEKEARRLQAIFDEEARMAKEEAKKEAQLVEE
ncbi:hypothetical protein Tco_1422316 [Tanacetum coccineum]